ncbi:MAG: site-2 protease family protein [Planctomycetota bacterium]
MAGKGLKLFKVFGFTVRMDLSWLVILVLVVWSLGGGVLPNRYPGLARGTYYLMGLAGGLGLFASIVFHELWHSLLARTYGIQMRGITLFIFGGLAEMEDEPPSARAEFVMAAAGPASSAVLGALALGLARVGKTAGWPIPVWGIVEWIGILNLVLAVFNLIPGFPLDGGRILRAILWQWKRDLRYATRIASRVGSAFGLGLMGFGILRLLRLDPIGGLWYLLIGMFLRSAAMQGYQQVLIRKALEGERVRRFMSAEAVSVPPELSVADLVENYVYRYHFKMFPVVEGERLVGCVTTRQIREVPRDRWAQSRVGEISVGCEPGNVIGPDEDAMKALSRMQASRASRLMVVEEGRLAGILSLKDLLGFLSLKLELEGEVGGGNPPPQEG